MTIDVIETMAEYENICNYIHLPIQSGSDRILKKMNRLHTREEYINLIKNIREIIPNCGISHDMITGFPTETEIDHQDTLSLMEEVKYDFGYMFAYSERPGTYAARNFKDDVSPETKQRRLEEIITVQQKLSFERNKRFLNNECSVLIDKSSKKSNEFWSGRTSENNVVVFPKYNFSLGDIVNVKVENFTTATLIGDVNKVKV
jgi:tRNA-2-methylthio-N6-dimethylallyladenosine synthase